MDFKVIFTDPFVEDLQRIVESIAAHNPAAALQLGELIIKTGESLSFFPERWQGMAAADGRLGCGRTLFSV